MNIVTAASVILSILILLNIIFLAKLHKKNMTIKGLKEIIAILIDKKLMLELRDQMSKKYIKSLENRLAEYEPDAYDKVKLPPCMKDLASKTCDCHKQGAVQ